MFGGWRRGQGVSGGGGGGGGPPRHVLRIADWAPAAWSGWCADRARRRSCSATGGWHSRSRGNDAKPASLASPPPPLLLSSPRRRLQSSQCMCGNTGSNIQQCSHSVLHRAAYNGHDFAIRAFVESGLDIDLRSEVSARRRWTAGAGSRERGARGSRVQRLVG